MSINHTHPHGHHSVRCSFGLLSSARGLWSRLTAPDSDDGCDGEADPADGIDDGDDDGGVAPLLSGGANPISTAASMNSFVNMAVACGSVMLE
eukprot:5507181-Karenia_brevis.AAC.1